MVIAEDDKQLQKVEQFEAGEETGSEIKEATEETNKRVIQSNKNHDTLDVIGTSSPIATNEEANLNVEGYRTLKDESILDQNVEVISNQQASFKEIPQSIEKEMKGAQKYEAGETKLDKSSYAESSEQVISTIEATVGQNDKASVHTPVLTVESSNTNVETVTDPCTKSETIDKSSTTATILFQEELGETNLKGVENKEHESYSDLVTEEKGTEAIRPSEEIGNEKVEKDNVTCDSIEDVSFSTVAERPDSQNDKEAALDIGDDAEDKLEGSSVTLPKYTASQQEDGPKVEEKTKEAASIECEEKNQETTELNKQEKYMTPVEDEMQNNNRSDTPFVREEMHLQEVDNSDIFKLDPKIGVENIVIDSTKEVINQAESYEKIAQADGSASESDKDVENYSKKPDAFSMACEEGMQSKGEDLDRAEASAGENRANEGFTAIVNEDNINKTELIEAIEHSKLASTEHGGSPDLSLLQQHEPEKEKPERPLNVISEEIETAVSRENVEFENPEDGSKEKRKDDKPTATYDIIGHEIPGQKNLPLIDANEKTESAEDEIPNNNANDLHVRHLLDEETGQVAGERTDEQIRKSDGTSVHEKRQVANASEAYESTESTISEHTSTEGTVRMEMIAKTRENIKELETVYGLDSEEKIEDKFAEANMPEVTNKEAAIDTEIHRITTKSNDTEEGLLEDDTTKVYSTVHTGDETATIQVESLKEAASNFSGEDEKKIEEEAHDGHTIQGSGDADKEKIEEANVTFVTPKVIEKETKNYQDNEKETKMSREEDDSLEIIKEGNVNDLSRKSTGEGLVQIFEDNNKEAKKSTGEIFEELQTARTGESLAHEKIHDVESPGKIPYGSLVKQEEGLWQEAKHLASAKDGDEDTSSVQVAEDNNDNNRLAEATENSAKVTLQGEEDSEQGLEINESGESIVVESPENILHTSLVKQKEGLKGGGEDLDSTEGSIESRDEETSFIKVAEDNGKNNRPAETTESSVKVVPKVEDSDYVLQNNEPGETNHEGESPGEILDTVKPKEGLQGDIENQAPAEASTEKRDVDTSSVKVPEDNIDNNRLAEATENSAKARPEGKEISEDTLQKDEPGEIIARETNHGAESPENCPDHPLVKQEEGLRGECKKPAPTEAAIEKRDEDVSCVEVAGDNDNIDGVAETTENSTKVTPEGGEDSEKAQQIDEPGQNIVGVTNHNVDSPENNLDISLVKQEDGIQGEDDNLAPTKTSIENTDEDTFPVKVDEDNDNNNKQVETTKNSVKVTPKGEEDSEQLLQKDDPQENPVQGRNHEVESPEEVLDNLLVNQEEDLQGKGENLAPTEASIENKDEDGSPAIVAEHKDDTNVGDEARENSAQGEPKGEEDSEDILQKDAVGEGIACDADPELESPEKTLNTPPVKQEEGLQGEDENPIPTEASIEKRDEDTCSIKMAEGNDENNRLAEPAENSAKVTAKGEEDLEQVFQKDEPREQIEVFEEEIKEETLRQEENIDDSHSASVIVVSEQVGLREAEPENNEQVESFDNQENSKDQESSGSETTALSTNPKNLKTEKLTNEDLSSTVGEVSAKKSLKENESDTTNLKEEVKGTNLEFVEHIETIDLIEETKSGILQDCVESNRDFNALTITNVPEVSEEDIKEEPWSQKESIVNDSYSASATAVSEEAGLKEAEPENNEQIKSFDYKEISEEDQESKGSDTGASSTNAEKLNTKKPANEDLSSSVREVSAKEILKEDESEATKLKEEVKGIDLGFVEQIEAMNLTEETKSGTLQVCAQPNRDFDALTITNVPEVSEEKIKEETLSQEESIIYDSYFASATDVSAEAGLKEAEPENNEQITRIDYKEISEEDQESRESETAASSTNAEKLNTEKPANEDLSSSIGEVSAKEILKEDEGDATKLKEEDKGTDLEFAEQIQAIDLTKETKSGTLQDCIERNRDFDGLTITNMPKVSEEEIKEETLSQEESIINDSYSASATVVCEEEALKEVEPENNVQIKSFDYKEISEENQESRESETAASSTNTENLNTEKPTSEDIYSSVEEVSAKEIIKEDKSDATKLKEEVKGTDLEFVEQIQAKDLTEETKSGTLQDCTEQNWDFNSLTIINVPEVSEEEIKEETLGQEEGIINDSYSASAMVVSEEAGLKEAEPENNEQMKSFDYKEISEEDQESRGSETAASSTNPKKVNTEKPANADLSSSVGEVSAKEILKQDESDATKLKEEAKSTDLEFIEQIEAIDLIEETKSETLQVCAEPNRDFNALPITNVPELSEEEIKEDTLSHKESIINDSYSASATVVSKEAGLKEVEPENNEQIKSFDYKEISKEDQESRESATATSSINAEKLNTEKPTSEDLSLSVEQVSAKEIIKEDESDATKLKEEVKGTDLESVEQIQAIELIEETKSGTLQDCAERNRDFNSLTITNVPEVSEDEIKEETLSQEEGIINDSYFASATVESEEAGLKEAEPENNEQIKTFDYKEISEEDQESRGSETTASSTNPEKLNTEKPTSEDLSSSVGEVSAKEILEEDKSDAMKLKEEVKSTDLEFIEQIEATDLIEETKSETLQVCAEPNRDFNALTITNVSELSEEEIKEDTLSHEESIINHSYSASATVVSKEAGMKEVEPENNEQIKTFDYKEIFEEDQESRESVIAASSTNAEKLNTEKPASEDLSLLVEQVSAKEIIKEDESDATKLKEEVKGTDLESVEQIQAIDLIEETKSGTLQDCAERNRDFNSLTITNVPEVSEEEIKEETLSQEEGIINDSYSASTTVESEEAGLKEDEPENNEQIKSFDYKEISEEDQESRGSETAASSTNPEKLNTEKPASEDLFSSVGEVSAKEILKEDKSDAMKLKEEVKGTNLEFIEQIEATDLTEETKSRTLQDRAEPNKDFSALTITNVSEEEIKEETLSPKENIINDFYSASTTVVSKEASLKEAEPVNNEQVQSSDNKETSKEDQEFRGSQTIVSNKSNTEKPSNEDLSSSIGEVSVKESLKEDKSEDTTLKEEVKGTNLEFIEQIETIDLTEETKSGTLQDYAEPEKDFSALTIANLPDVSKEKIKEETLSQEENIINDSYSASATVVSEEAGLKEAEPENNEQIKSFENKEIYEEDQEYRESETTATSTNAEELNTQKSANEDLSSLVGEVSAKEILREDESDATKLKEEVKGTNMEFIEQIEAIDLTEETKSGTLQDHAESNKDYSALTIPKVPEVSEEEIKEESLKQEEKIINDFDSTSVIVVSEEASLKEAELENNDQVKSSDSSPDGKDLATIETEGTSLKSVNIDVKQKEYFNSEVNKDNDILPLIDEGEEKLEHQMEDKAPARVIDNEIELTTGETPLRDEITHEKVKSPSNVQKTNEKSTQKGDESIKSKDLTKLLSSDDGKEGAIQELQKHKDTELHMALELHNEKNSYDIEDEKISKSRETSELAGQTEVCNLETQKDENPSHEVLKTVVVGTCKDNEKAILEQEGSVQNFEDCLTDVVVEKGTVDLEAGAGSQECEPTNSKDKKLLVKKNLESADLGQKLDFVSESVSKDQSDETFPQTNKGQTEESSNDIQDGNSEFVERQIIGEVQHETERKMAMQPKLEAKDHINVSQYAKETITNVIATEEVHEGVEKVDGSESIKEHAIHGESDLKEIHTVSAGDEILEKVKDSGPESTEYLKATDFNEQTETLNTGIEEDPTREAEAPGTKAPEEEKIQDEGSLKSADEDTEEKIKEEIKVQVDDLHEKNDNVTVVAAESSSGEAQMDDKHVKDTSSDESLETIKTEQCPQAEEVSSKKPEKTSSCLVSQLPNMDLKNVGKESVTLDEPGTDEVEETKTISSAVFQSKYHGVEETNKTGQSLIVEKLDADGTEEAIKRASGTVSESKFLGIEVVTEDEITADQTLPTGKLEEQFQTPSSELLSLEQEHGPTIIAKETEAIKTREGEMLDDSSATKDTEEMCLQKEEQLQTLSSTLLSKEQEHGTTIAFKKIEGESTREADNKNINNSSVIKATKETCLEQEEPRELNVSKLGIEINKDIQMDSSNKLNKEECCTSDGATKLETEENEERKYSHALSESEKTGELTRQFEEPSNLSFEISEKDFEPVLDVHSHEVLISSEEKVQDEGIVKLVDVSTIVAEESLENIKEEIIGEVDNSCDKTENATTEVVTAESSSGEPQLHDMSTKDIISHERCQETIIMESSPLAEEVASMKLEGTSSNLPSQLPNMISANAEKEGETLDSPDAHEVEETETTSDSVFESKYQSVKETDETGQSLKVEKLDAADIEEIKEPSETLSKPKALEVETVSEDGVIADQTLPAGMLSEQLQTLSSSVLSREQEHGTTTTVERTEQERTEEVQTLGTESIDYSSAAKTTEGTCFKKEELREFEVPTVGLESGKAIPRDISSEVQKEESITLDQASKLEPQEKEEIKYADSPSESEEIKELARPIEEASNHNFEISEKAADHMSEVQSHEVLTKSEDISEKHLEAVVINLKTEESQCRKTAEANQKSKNEVSIEGVRELYHDYKEISEEDQESRVSNTAISSTNLEKVNTEKPANADLSSSVAEVSAKEILKQDESDATKLKEEVKGTDLEFVEQIQAIDLTEETKSGTLQDCGGRNRDFNALTITNVLEEEIKEETLSQEESIIYDSYSASAMVVSEEAGLKEAEPEKNEQIKSFNYKEISEEDQESRESEAAASSTNAEKLNTEKPANEDLSSFVGEVSAKEIIKEHESDATKLKEEVKGTHLEFVEQIQEIDLTEETKSGTLQDPAERNRDFNALTITNVSEEEIKEETLSPEENIINDSYSASAMVVSEEACLKEAEAVNNEQVQSSDHKETSKQDQEFRGSQTIVSNKSNTEKPSNEDLSSSIGEVLAKESLKEDESEDTTLKEEVKGTNLEFIEQIETIDLTEETKSGTLQDCAELEKDFSALTIANVPDVSEEKIKEETLSQEENIINDSCSASTTVVSEEACLKEAEPENNEQIKSFENKEIYEEDQESRESETAASSTNAEELNTEKPANEDLSSSVGEVSAKETLKEDESDAAKLKEEVKGTNLEFIEQIEAIDLIEETKSRTLQDRAESNKDFSALTIPKVPEVSEEEIKEETLKQEEKIINDFDSTSLIVVSEEASLKEAELENIDQVKSSDISPDGKDLATIETEGTSLESVNIDVKPKEYFNSEVNKDNDILPLVDEGGEKLEHQMEDKAPARVIDNEIELTIGETPLRDEITHENVKSPSSVQKIDEKSTQKGDESIKSKDLTELLSSDDGKEGAIEEVQEHKDTELHMAPELHNEKNSYDTEDEEISKSGETGELAGQTEICNLETEKDENPSHEALKTVAVGTCKNSEKAILEQEDSVQNFEESLTGVVVEKGSADLEAGTGSHECEPTNSKGNKLLVEKNLESADLGQKFDFVSESVSKDQSDETFPQTSKGQTEESSDDVQDWNSKFVERQIIGQVQHETERKMAMQPQLEAEDHINVSQYAKETITNVIATEEVHEGVEKVDGSESIKEHAIHGESDLTEIHTVSVGDEILEKVKDSGPESTKNLKATDFNEQTATLNTGIEEDPTREEEAPGTKAPEEEKIQDEGSLKPVDEDTEEKIKEEIKVQVDDFHDKNDNATVVAAESSSGEAQMDDKHVKDTSSDESLETIKTNQCPQAEEVGSKKPEKTSSSLVSQLPNTDHKNVEKESVTLDEPNADEVEETKTVFQSKYHGVEETDKTGQSLRVEKLDADGTEEAMKEASGTVSESKFLGIEAITEDEITADQTLPTGKLEEQFQTPSSKLLSLEQERGPTIIVKETEEIKTREGEMLDDKKIDDSSATKATEDMCLQKEEQLQTLSSTMLSREQEHGTTTAFKKAEGESTREADNKNINNSSAIKATEETCLEQEEPRELNVSKLGIEINKEIQMDSSNKLNKEECCTSDGARKLGTEENEERKYSHALSESEKTGELTRQIEEPSNISFDISEKAFEPVLDVHSHEVHISSEEKVQDEGIVKLVDVSTTVAEESLENIKEEIIVEVDNSCDKTENANAEMVTAESSSGEPQLHDMSTKDIISHERCQETIIMESSPLAEEVASMKLEETSSNLPSQLPNMISENAEKEGETLESLDAHGVEETETTSDSVFESKYQSVKETDETGQSLKVEKLDATDIEDVKETSETMSKPKALEVEAVSEDGVIADQTLPAGMLSEQLQTLSSSVLSREQEHGTTTTVERTEQESTKEVQTLGTKSIDDSSAAKTTEGTCFKKEELREFEVPTVGLESGKAIPRDISNEVRKEESITLDQASKLEPQEKEEIKYADSPSESEEIKELTRPIEEASNHNFEISKKASDHVSEVQSHEVLTKSEDISEKHLEAVVINLKTEESQCKKTAEANQKSKNEVSIEGVPEDKEVSMDSKSVYPGEETTIESHQGDESKTEEYLAEDTNKTFKATTNVNQHEVFRPSEIIDKGSASESIEKKITAEDRTVEDDNATESFPDEAKGKNVEEAAVKLELEHQSGETNLMKGTPEVITPGEKEAGVEISQGEGTTGFSEVTEINQNIQQLGMTSYAASQTKISEAGPSESTEPKISTGHEDVPPVLQHPIDETLQKVETERTRPVKATEIDAEVRGVECQGEKRMVDSGEKITEESAKFSLSDLMQKSMKENPQVAKDLTKERHPMLSKAEMQNEEAETTQFGKAKTDEEEGDEHKRTDPDSDAPVMVEASKDIDVKVAHKKSHSILSGVGSKVKHSISKVKKAITGKSSHPKTQSPK